MVVVELCNLLGGELKRVACDDLEIGFLYAR